MTLNGLFENAYVFGAAQKINIDAHKGQGQGRYSSSWGPHLRATVCHLPYGFTQCYLPPDTSECAPPNPSHAIYLPRRDGRLRWPRWLDSALAGSRTSDLSITSPTPNQNFRFSIDFAGHCYNSAAASCAVTQLAYCFSSLQQWWVMNLSLMVLIRLCLLITLSLAVPYLSSRVRCSRSSFCQMSYSAV